MYFTEQRVEIRKRAKKRINVTVVRHIVAKVCMGEG